MHKKKEFIYRLACFLIIEGKKISFAALATLLNDAGFRTETGELYNEKGGRGVARLVKEAWDTAEFDESKNPEYIELSFVDCNGNYAYE